MKPHEQKANDIFERYYNLKWIKTRGRTQKTEGMSKETAIECAKIAIDEAIKVIDLSLSNNPKYTLLEYHKDFLLRVKESLNTLK